MSRIVLAGALIAALGAGVQIERRAAARTALLRADPEAVLQDPAMAARADAQGAPLFADHCAACHGAQGRGNPAFGVPDLTDQEHLYGTGSLAEIEQIVRYGIRSRHSRGWNLASMPGYARARPSAGDPAIRPLTPAQVEDLTQFVLGLGGRASDMAAMARGQALYGGAGGCYDCHGADAGGDPSIGAPSLSDAIWLYGGDAARVRQSIAQGRAGVSPAFAGRLDAAQIRAVAVHVARLSAGTSR